jgi:NAD(P)-dependent dehydrogenase (short-subunit alcohol dehydrogenase family)
MKNAVITGVSTGIGHGTAAALLARGWRVFGSVRSAERGEALSREWGERFTPLLFDVTDRPAINRAADEVKAALAGQGLDGLVNNAGISLAGPLFLQDPEIVRRHLDVNVMGVVHATQAFLPLLRRPKGSPERPGRIVNMSSASGRIGFPFVGAYVASKHALEGMSDSLRRELLIYGVDVIVIEPGAIDTPIWHKAEGVRTEYADSDFGPLLQGMNPEDNRRAALPVSVVAERIVEALEARRPKARYAIPDQPFKFWILPRLLPDRWLDRLVDRMLGYQKIRDSLRD